MNNSVLRRLGAKLRILAIGKVCVEKLYWAGHDDSRRQMNRATRSKNLWACSSIGQLDR